MDKDCLYPPKTLDQSSLGHFTALSCPLDIGAIPGAARNDQLTKKGTQKKRAALCAAPLWLHSEYNSAIRSSVCKSWVR
jgi:hypothetical protein